MRKVACVRFTDECYDCSTLIKHITEWTEIDDETYYNLVASQKQFNFVLIEFLDPGFIPKTVADYAELMRKHKEETRERHRLAEEKRLKKAEEKAAREASKNIERYDELKAELARIEEQILRKEK